MRYLKSIHRALPYISAFIIFGAGFFAGDVQYLIAGALFLIVGLLQELVDKQPSVIITKSLLVNGQAVHSEEHV